ncbi:MAG: zinc ribbon domain-containing protein [Sphaerochaetaceae bacterium]|jgi:predicted nucleic-acid-binding Zn-ribbon protein|nr:zinc ribbon domain-containing protein [Sphaerochaetaceae bacterium]MDD3162540.1 zinc ribbon domain-containing protein [Sphaerochaetaceae bacterium]MDD4006370.1 zinc ribbon domain-containing protein [Sphaerochaetaceae bacterium]MDD4396019.1 zinc ribbon domain-containing protein [Sphaerochaetaceae bacterium]
MEKHQYVCPKCGNTHFIEDKLQATGGNFAKLFDVQNKRFVTISCTRCGYTELFRQDESVGLNILDFFMGN